jgi:hypothetical protein
VVLRANALSGNLEASREHDVLNKDLGIPENKDKSIL